MSSSHVWSEPEAETPPLLPHTRLSLPEKASVGLKLSEPISQIQVLQRGNAQRSANPLLVFSMRVWLGQGHRVKRTHRGPGLRSWFIPSYLQFLCGLQQWRDPRDPRPLHHMSVQWRGEGSGFRAGAGA